MTATPIQTGQRWQRRTRFKAKPVVRVRQVHRKDLIVEVVSEIDGTVGVLIPPLRFAELRSRYRLVSTPGGATPRPPATRSTDRRSRRHETRVYDRIQAVQLRRDVERRARKHAHGRMAGLALEAA